LEKHKNLALVLYDNLDKHHSYHPKNTVVRIFNAGDGELVLIEVLSPSYKKELVQEFKNFKAKG
jgi:hypothetical protein|tara:strand:+ start:52 stop:243 length:192 start_codon:yes stop_codon:yes gene_type:complete